MCLVPLDREQSRLHSELRGKVSQLGADLDSVRRIHGEPGNQQADGEAAADAMVQEGWPPSSPDAYEGSEQRVGGVVSPMVPELWDSGER